MICLLTHPVLTLLIPLVLIGIATVIANANRQEH